MSLILDALRKADAERERGSVPSLHSHPVVPVSAETPSKPVARPNWVWIAIGAAVGLAVAAAWVMVGRDAPPQSAIQVMPAAPSSPATPSGAPALAVPAPAGAVGAASGTGPLPPAVAPTDAQAVADPAPWRLPEERKALRPDGKGDAPVPVPVLGNMPLTQAPVLTREQLPPDIRAALPQFAIGGSMYSPNPAARSLIVNGQLYRERDRLTQDLALEEIKLKAAVFNFRGHRFEVLF